MYYFSLVKNISKRKKMMNRISVLGSAVLLGIILTLSSCGSKDAPLENIIKNESNIAAVGKINIQQIIDKGDFWKEFGWIKLFTGKLLDSTEWGMNIFSEKSFVLTANAKNEQEFLITTFDINSADNFKNKIEEMTSGETQTIGGFTMIYNEFGSDDFSIAWNDAIGIAVGGIKPGVNSKDKLEVILGNLSNASSAPLTKEISDVLTSNKDMVMLVYADKLSFDDQGVKMDEEAKEYLKGASSLITLNGEKGRVDFEVNGYGMDKLLNSKYNVLDEKGVSKELFEKAMTKHAIGWLSMSMEKDQLKNMLLEQLDKEMRGDVASKKMAEELVSAMGSDMAMSFGLIDNKDIPVSFKAVVAVNDMNIVKAMMDTMPEFVRVSDNGWKFSEKINRTYTKFGTDISREVEEQKDVMFVNLNKHELVVSSDSLTAFATEVSLPDNYASIEQKDLPVSFYVDMENVLGSMDDVPEDVQDIIEVISFAKGNSNLKHTEFTISFKNKDENGWKQLFKALGGQIQNLL